MAQHTNHRFIRLIRRFQAATEGTISILAVFVMLLMMTLIAISIDMSRLVQSSAQLKSINDMATIAASEDPNLTPAEREAVFNKVMELGVARSKEITGYDTDLSIVETAFLTTVTATTRSESEVFFPSTSGGSKFVSAHSQVIVGKEFVEVALVLDVSSSMVGARITELKLAATAFIDILLEDPEIRDRVSVSIVPYGGTVRVPQELRNMLIEPDTNEHWFDGEWNGCFRMNTDVLNEALSPDDQFNYIPSFVRFTDNNTVCPSEGNELNGLSNDRDELLAKIDSFQQLSDGTGSDVGVAWGLATLDPQWRGQFPGVDSDFPRDFAEGTRKIMVVMTDGGITPQYYPRENDFDGDLPYDTTGRDNNFNQSLNGFREFCGRARAVDVDVYTVGFSLNNQTQVNRLQECGTSQSHNFQANLGDLELVFENLASSITSLRLSQ